MARHLLLVLAGAATVNSWNTFVSIKARNPSASASDSANTLVDISNIPWMVAASSANHSILVDRQLEIERCLGGAVKTLPNAAIQWLFAPSDRCDATPDEVCDYLAAAAEEIGNLQVTCVQHMDAADYVVSATNGLMEGRKVADAVNDPLRTLQGYLDMSRVADAWPYMAAPQQPRPVIIAIIDSGINEYHQDLVNMLWNDGHGHHGFNTNTSTTTYDITDERGHGTCMAGIAAAQMDNNLGMVGVAGFSHLVKIMTFKGTSHDTKTDFMGPEIRALRIAALYDADIVLMPWGIPVTSDAFTHAIQQAASRMVLVSAAGHGGSSVAPYPCAYPETICVTGTLNHAKQLDPVMNWGVSVDVAATGEYVLGTDYKTPSGYDFHDGSSDASAIVAGVVAMMMSLGATPSTVKSTIMANSDALDPFPGRHIAGGFINAFKAVKAVVGTP